MNIAANIRQIKREIPEGVELVAVSKFHSAEMILEAYNAGQRNFGESRVQEFIEKEKLLPKDIKWHFIGHLQTNKVKQLIGKTSLIESVDSPRLLELINRESEKGGIVTDILFQLHVAKEETKFGFYPTELIEYLKSGEYKSFKFINIRGLMGMASNTDDQERIKEDFSLLHNLFETIKEDASFGFKNFNYLSMGMSSDWPLAIEEGANIIRVGSAIFGNRVYT